MVDGQFKPGEFVLEVCKINLVNGQEIDLTQGDATVLGIKFHSGSTVFCRYG